MSRSSAAKLRQKKSRWPYRTSFKPAVERLEERFAPGRAIEMFDLTTWLPRWLGEPTGIVPIALVGPIKQAVTSGRQAGSPSPTVSAHEAPPLGMPAQQVYSSPPEQMPPVRRASGTAFQTLVSSFQGSGPRANFLVAAGWEAPWLADAATALMQPADDGSHTIAFETGSAFISAAVPPGAWSAGAGSAEATTATQDRPLSIFPLPAITANADQQLEDTLLSQEALAGPRRTAAGQNHFRPPQHKNSALPPARAPTPSIASPSGASTGGSDNGSGSNSLFDAQPGYLGVIRPICDDVWTVVESGGSPTGHGTVTHDENGWLIREGDSYYVGIQRTFVVPQNPTALTFTYTNLSFDMTDPPSINDAFESSVIDPQGQNLR